MFEELNKRRQAVAYNIAKSFENDIEKAIGAGYDLEGGNGDEVEKAHQVGDVHSNGKWVWTEYAPGKFDWRGIKKNATEKKQKVEGSGNDGGNASTASTATTAKTDDTKKKKIIAKQAKADKVFDQMSKFLKTKKIDGFELWADKNHWNEFYNKFDDKLRSLGFSIGRNYKRSLSWNIYSKDSDFSDSVASVGTDNDLSSLRKKIKELMEA